VTTVRRTRNGRTNGPAGLPKTPTGIRGLDDITGGGLPRGRPTLVCGAAGCGKTLLAMEFLVHGARRFDEPGVFVSFEERVDEMVANVTSLGFDLRRLEAARKLAFDHVRIERSEIEETGEYDLEALFIRLGHAIDSIGAKRVVLDTIESLFAGLADQAVLRAELRRLFAWLKERRITAIITGERGDGQLTRHGLEEYVSDCVILLDHRVEDRLATRRLRVVKYRGSAHGTDEYPFLIDATGITVLPVSSVRLDHRVTTRRVSTGVPGLDAMFGGRGYYEGSSILVSGEAGTGKTSLAAYFADATCRRAERCLFFSFEESPAQLVRNMRSVGIDLEPWMKRGLLRIRATRPTFYGLEMHLATMQHEVAEFRPASVVVDPLSPLISRGSAADVSRMLLRLVDDLKSRGTTALFTSLAHAEQSDSTDVLVSSLMDSWIFLRNLEDEGERNRGIYVLKSRGMAHSNQIREFLLHDRGIELRDVYTGEGKVLTGSARLVEEARERAAAGDRRLELSRRQRQSERRRAALAAQIAALQAELTGEAENLRALSGAERKRDRESARDRRALLLSRRADGRVNGAARSRRMSS
jgi:circadian clock protein KaiC